MYCNEFYITKKNPIPAGASIATNYKEFRNSILERLSDINLQIRSVVRTLETETAILKKNADILTERDKKTIHNYIIKLRLDLEGLIPIRDDLMKLSANEKAMFKLYQKMSIIIRRHKAHCVS